MATNNKPDQETFSEKLKWLIKKNNIRNIDLANHLGVVKSTISNYTAGRIIPDSDVIYKIAEYFDVSFYELIGSTVSIKPDVRTNEGDGSKFSYELPLFNNILDSDQVIYVSTNYIGTITSPIPVNEDSECYAIIAKDNSMESFGIVAKSCVVFSAATEVASGEIGAVLIKSKKEIFIRSVSYENKKIILTSDKGSESYKKEKSGCDAVILGKVYCATFDPNNIKTK